MRETYFSRLHPAVCFGFLVSAICMAVVIQHPAYLLASVLAALCMNITLSGRRAVKNFARILPLWALISAVNPILNLRGERVLFEYLGRPYTLEALCYGMVRAGMFAAMLARMAVYNAVLTEDRFSYLFAALAPSMALLLTTVLRMIPNLLRRAKQILVARRCVGLGGEGDVCERLNSGLNALSVLTSWALEGSVVTADSMNSRGYGPGRRSCYHNYRMDRSALCVSIALAALLVCALIALLHGGGAANYTPEMAIAPVKGENGWGLAAYALFLLLPTFLNLKEELQWIISRSRI